jgi:hypothetical protein
MGATNDNAMVQANFQLPKSQVDWLREQSFRRTQEAGKRISQADIVRQALADAGAPSREAA